MGDKMIHFWAKTVRDNQGIEWPGISVADHCLNVGCVAEAIIDSLPARVRGLLPGPDGRAAALLAALHDVGKITVGFQIKCPAWRSSVALPPCSIGEVALSVTDHAFVSQAFLQMVWPAPTQTYQWAIAVGAHHGRPKGRSAKLNQGRHLEVLSQWAQAHRLELKEHLEVIFGPMPVDRSNPPPAPDHSGLWLLAGLITVADWIGSNEVWFSPKEGQALIATQARARGALHQIGWPGGLLRSTEFGAAFWGAAAPGFQANPVQAAVAAFALQPGIIIVEGPMGCGKTEAALFAAQQLIAAGHNQGIYFALPTQVTSNRIHRRVHQFLRNTLAADAPLRLAHGNAWLEDDFDLRLSPAFTASQPGDGQTPGDDIREIRSWFATAKQALLAPYGVGTIDQALQAVVAVKHFFVRRFALAGKVVILDEIHSYDLYTGTLVTALVRELLNLRCSVIILSATLTAERRRDLLAAAGVREGNASSEYPLITAGVPGDSTSSAVAPEWPYRSSVTLRPAVIPDGEVVAELIQRAESGQNVLWIRNTVVEAQEAYRMVAANQREGSARLALLHSRFPFAQRQRLESVWLRRLGADSHRRWQRRFDPARSGRNRPSRGSILIATQVVEQSVDIDLDFMVSDLAPTDMLLQRVGRLWRHKRPYRAATSPEFWIRLPDLPKTCEARDLTKALGRSGRVYAPYVLLRTLQVWSGKSQLNVPADIRPLLEDTYAEPSSGEPSTWRELRAELEAERQRLVANAEAATLVLGRPALDDHEEILTRRKGAPTIPILLLHSVVGHPGGNVQAVALNGTTAEIGEYAWSRRSARFLHQAIVRVPRWMIPAEVPHPPWLSLHGPVGATFAIVNEAGCCEFSGKSSHLHYTPNLGIFSQQLTSTARQWKEDDDEFDF